MKLIRKTKSGLFAFIILMLLCKQSFQQKSVFSVPVIDPTPYKSDLMDVQQKFVMPGTVVPVPPKDTMGSAILFKGWMRYYVYQHTGNENHPQKFEYNPEFDTQFGQGQVPSSVRDKYGFLDIPSDTSFFFILTYKALYVLSGRKVSLFY